MWSSPAGCSGDSSTLRFITSDPFVPGYYDTCSTTVHCGTPTGVPGSPTYGLSFFPPRPNPSHGRMRLGYTLSRPGPVRLELFGASGARVLVLDAGVRSAGPHELTWEGTDEAAAPSRPAPTSLAWAPRDGRFLAS